MTLTPSNMHSCNPQHHIWSVSIQMSLNPSNVQNCTQQHQITQIRFSSIQITFNISKDAQMHSTISTHHSNASNMHPSMTTHSNKHIQPPNVHLYTYNASNSKRPSLQTPTDATNMHQCTSNTKHPKSFSKLENLSRSTS